MKRKLDYFEAHPSPRSNLDVDIVPVGEGAPKRRKLVKIVEGVQYVVSDRRLRIYIDKTRNDLDFIKSKLFGNMEFVVGGMDHPHLLSETFLERLEIDFVCQISNTPRDVHPENVVARTLGKLIVIIPLRRFRAPDGFPSSSWESFRFGLPPVAPPMRRFQAPLLRLNRGGRGSSHRHFRGPARPPLGFFPLMQPRIPIPRPNMPQMRGRGRGCGSGGRGCIFGGRVLVPPHPSVVRGQTRE